MRGFDMEKWEEIFVGLIPKGQYMTNLTNGEETGLIVQLFDETINISLDFGCIYALRMLDEGLVQSSLYSDEEIKVYKENEFSNVIYKLENGEFMHQTKEIAGNYSDFLTMNHYLIVTMNYCIDIISAFEPTICVTKQTCN